MVLISGAGHVNKYVLSLSLANPTSADFKKYIISGQRAAYVLSGFHPLHDTRHMTLIWRLTSLADDNSAGHGGTV